jgi:hypothetical protein
VISDYRSVFQSAIPFIKPENGSAAKTSTHAWGRIDKGSMPQDELWGMLQGFTLAYLITKDGPKYVADDKLQDSLIPTSVKFHAAQALRGEASLIRTKIRKTDKGRIEDISFWITRPGVVVKELVNGTDCMMIAELAIDMTEDSIPTKIRYINYLGHDDGHGGLLVLPSTESIFSGKLDRSPSIALLDQVSYTSELGALVNDFRFPGTKFGYMLHASDPPPFEGTPTYTKVVADVNLQDQQVRTLSYKKQAMIMVFFLILVPFIFFLKKKNIIQSKGKI